MYVTDVDTKFRNKLTPEQDASLAPLEVQSKVKRMAMLARAGEKLANAGATGISSSDIDAIEDEVAETEVVVTETYTPPPPTYLAPTAEPPPRRADSMEAGALLSKLVADGAHTKRLTFQLPGFKFSFQASMVSLTEKSLTFFLQKKALSFELNYLDSFIVTIDKQDIRVMYAGGYAEYQGMDFVIFSFIREPDEDTPP